jgi:hypothetical protein
MRRLETPQYEFALRDEAHIRGLFDRALRASRSESADAQAALRDGVCSFVRRARADSRQVETIMVALKDILGVPDRPSRSLRGDEDAPPAVLLARRVIRWCISEYYAEE